MLITLIVLAALADIGNKIDAFARKAMTTVGTPPGLAVVVVKDDQVVYRGDFGMRDAEAKLPATPDTRWYIGSTTKSFTAMAALILAEEGKLDFDAPLTTYWPELKLTPPLDAGRISLRDFLAMRPGLDNGAYHHRRTVIADVKDDKELVRILANHSAAEPRKFTYSNTSYDIAAEILEQVTGTSWQELTETKVFAPVGMTTATSVLPPPGTPIAYHHRSTAPGVFVKVKGKTNDSMGPAGGTYLTTNDAARWIIAMMNDGRLEGRQVLPRRAVRWAQSPQTVNKAKFAYFDRWGWGIGQDLGEYERELFVHRFGGFNGAFSHVSWMPDRRIGVAVFSNGGSSVANAVAAYAYDVLLGKPNLDAKWTPEIERMAAAVQKQRDATKAAIPVRRDPARPLAQYAGSYRSDRMGQVNIEVEGGKLMARYGVLRVELIPVGGDEFRVDWRDEGDPEPVKISFDANGRATNFEWDGRPFARVAQ